MFDRPERREGLVTEISTTVRSRIILGDPGAASRDDGIFMGESLQQERESPWALTLTKRVPEAFEIPPSDWPGDSHVFLHEIVFLINRRSSVARSTGTFLRRASEKKKIINEVEEIANYNVAARKQTLKGNFSRWTYRRCRKFLELATAPFSNVTNYFSFFVDLRLKLSISDARATQLC